MTCSCAITAGNPAASFRAGGVGLAGAEASVYRMGIEDNGRGAGRSGVAQGCSKGKAEVLPSKTQRDLRRVRKQRTFRPLTIIAGKHVSVKHINSATPVSHRRARET